MPDILHVHVGLKRAAQERLETALPKAREGFATSLGLSRADFAKLDMFGIVSGEVVPTALAGMKKHPDVDFVEADETRFAVAPRGL